MRLVFSLVLSSFLASSLGNPANARDPLPSEPLPDLDTLNRGDAVIRCAAISLNHKTLLDEWPYSRFIGFEDEQEKNKVALKEYAAIIKSFMDRGDLIGGKNADAALESASTFFIIRYAVIIRSENMREALRTLIRDISGCSDIRNAEMKKL